MSFLLTCQYTAVNSRIGYAHQNLNFQFEIPFVNDEGVRIRKELNSMKQFYLYFFNYLLTFLALLVTLLESLVDTASSQILSLRKKTRFFTEVELKNSNSVNSNVLPNLFLD